MEGGAAGSVWNRNAWHWEEKNYSQWGRNELFQLFDNFEFQLENFKYVKLQKTEITGDASVSIRKGKRILAFDFCLTFEWEAENQNGEKCSGDLKIPEFSVENVDDESYELRVSSRSGDEDAKKVKTFLEKNAKRFFNKKLEEFVEKFRKHDAEFSQKEKSFNSTEGEIKLNVEEKQKSEIERKKLNEEVKRADELRSCPVKVDEKEARAEGSVWNVNSYHWEEKQSSEWCRTHLTELFKNAKISVLNGTAEMTFFHTDVQGEGSVSIRKGKKIFFFDLKITADWTCTSRASDGKFMADAKGQINIPEFSSENITDADINYTFDSKHPASERINKAIRSEGEKQIQEILNKFVEDFRNK